MEPITADEARLFMRIDQDDFFDDALIRLMISANREFLEGELGLSLIPKTGLKYRYKYPCCTFPKRFDLPYGPVNNIIAVDGDLVPYTLANLSNEDEYPAYKPTKSVTITYDAGLWENGVPQGIKLALLMMVATNYENRENFVVGQTVNNVTQNAMQLAFKYSRNLYL